MLKKVISCLLFMVLYIRKRKKDLKWIKKLSNKYNTNYLWFVLGLIMTCTFMAILDSSIVNVALPNMMRTFGSGIPYTL